MFWVLNLSVLMPQKECKGEEDVQLFRKYIQWPCTIPISDFLDLSVRPGLASALMLANRSGEFQ
jgi:hypothetical protein